MKKWYYKDIEPLTGATISSGRSKLPYNREKIRAKREVTVLDKKNILEASDREIVVNSIAKNLISGDYWRKGHILSSHLHLDENKSKSALTDGLRAITDYMNEKAAAEVRHRRAAEAAKSEHLSHGHDSHIGRLKSKLMNKVGGLIHY